MLKVNIGVKVRISKPEMILKFEHIYDRNRSLSENSKFDRIFCFSFMPSTGE